MEALKVDRTKLVTKANYAKTLGISHTMVNKRIQAGMIKTVKIDGAELVLKD